MDNKNVKKSKKRLGIGLYVAGSIALAAGAMLVMPKVINNLSEKLYKKNSKDSTAPDDDNWGPEIVKNDSDQSKED